MALLHQAELRPSKNELIQGWAPTQPWFEGSPRILSVASFRFDDPDGEVGIETLLVAAGDGPVFQVPLTYRNSPLRGGDPWLIGTMQHSVLGQRWVYDATGDPVYLAAVATAALSGVGQAEQYFEIDGKRVVRDPTAVVAGSGTRGATVPSAPAVGEISTRHELGATIVEAGRLRLLVTRRIGGSGIRENDANGFDHPAEGVTREALTGTWTDQPEQQTLVVVLAG